METHDVILHIVWAYVWLVVIEGIIVTILTFI